MRISFRAIIAAVLATGLLTLPAQALDIQPVVTNKAPAVATKPAPKKILQPKGATQPIGKKAEPKPEPVFNPEPGVAKQANVNIRGQAKINSEIVGHLKKGDAVTILEEITLTKPKQDEPSRWFRITLPPSQGVWIHSSFVDGTTVKATKLNLRGGPGEEYSILGRLEKGATIKQIEAKGDWLKIEAPTNAYGFVAMHLLEKTPMSIVATPTTPKSNEVVSIPPPPPTTVAVPTDPTPAVATTTPVATNPAIAEATIARPPVPNIIPAPAEEVVEKVKKVVSREGILKGSVSIQAPTYFELRALDTGKTIDYVFSPSTNLMLKEYKGQRIIVTGEELLDERWQNTPVLIVDSLQTVP
jgi:SH3-like domain-containing protein